MTLPMALMTKDICRDLVPIDMKHLVMIYNNPSSCRTREFHAGTPVSYVYIMSAWNKQLMSANINFEK